MFANTATIWSAQGQVAGRRRRRCRPPWVSRGGDVEEPVAQRLGFAGGEPGGVTDQGEQAEPGDQVGGDRGDASARPG